MDPCDKLISCAQVFQNESLLKKIQEIRTLKNKLRRYEDPVILYESLDEYNNLYTGMREYISSNMTDYFNKKYEFINYGGGYIRNPGILLGDEAVSKLCKIIEDGILVFTKNKYKSWTEEYSRTMEFILKNYIELLSKRNLLNTRISIYNNYQRNIIDFIINYIATEKGKLSNIGYFKCEECALVTRIEYFISGFCDMCYKQ